MIENETHKEALLKQCLEYFKKFGSKNVTMDDLASELTISKKTLYKYFKSKEILVEECVHYLWKEFNVNINEILKKEVNPLCKIIVLYEYGIQQIRKIDPQFLYSLKRYYHKSMEMHDGFRRELIFKKILDLLNEAKNNGWIHQSVDLPLFCELNLYDFDEKLNKLQLFQRYSDEEILEQLIRNCLKGIVRPEYHYLLMS